MLADADGTTRIGYLVDTNDLGVSLENVHTDLADTATTLTFHLTNASALRLYFPSKGDSCALFCEGLGPPPATPTEFIARYPVTVGHVPILGPVEYQEPMLREETVRAALATPRAARHFRNFWYHYPEGFSDFATLLAQTWPGMEIEPPEVQFGAKSTIAMFCREARMTRELYWAGFGFQVWCQLLTHIRRAERDTILIVDEPEVYLHPDLQRQLVHVLRSSAAKVILATHSTEMLNEAEAADIVLVDKRRSTARRLRGGAAMRVAKSALGVSHNAQLAQLARNKRVVIVEGDNFTLLRRIARRTGYAELANGAGITFVPLPPLDASTTDGQIGDSLAEAVHFLSAALSSAVGERIEIGVVLDRRFRTHEELSALRSALSRGVRLVHIHGRYALENYLLDPRVLDAALARALVERRPSGEATASPVTRSAALLERVTDAARADLRRVYVDRLLATPRAAANDPFLVAMVGEGEFDERWADLDARLAMVPGEPTFAGLSAEWEEAHGVTVTERDVVDAMIPERLPPELLALLQELDAFRRIS
jgi:hypothetical protein